MESHTRLVPSILDLRNVSFLQQPRGPSCSAGVEAVVVVLSAPANTHRRDKLRRQFRGVVAHVQNQPEPNPILPLCRRPNITTTYRGVSCLA